MRHTWVTGFWVLIGIIVILTSATWAADFTQAERDSNYIKSCRRQDQALDTYFAELVPPDVVFNHSGAYTVTVHREGLARPITLIPVHSLCFADVTTLRESSRSKPVVIGAIEITYAHNEPLIKPGTHLLLFNGVRFIIRDVHGFDTAAINAKVEEVPAAATVDPALGTLAGSAYSLANITPEGELQIFLQLCDENGKALKQDDGFQKVLLSAPVAGLVADDDTPLRELAQPAEEEDAE